MTQTCIGIVTDALGGASSAGRFWSTPSRQVLPVQDAPLLVDVDHNSSWVGEIIHLELRDKNLWAVAHIDDSVEAAVHVRVGADLVSVEHPLYWSATRVGGPEFGIALSSVALTTHPARVCPRPVRLLPGNLNFTREPPRGWELQPAERAMLERACETVRARRKLGRDAPLLIHGQDALEPATRAAAGGRSYDRVGDSFYARDEPRDLGRLGRIEFSRARGSVLSVE